MQEAVKLTERAHRTDKQQQLFPSIGAGSFVAGYFGLALVRYAGWIPRSWSLMPVVETAWLSFLLVLALMIWMWATKIPLVHIGLRVFRPSRSLLKWVIGTMVIDSLAIGMARPALVAAFGEAQQLDRFRDLPGNLGLLLAILPLVWLLAAFGEEFFFRGFLLTVIAEALGASRAAWVAAVLVQAIGFGLIHAYQGPVQAISIGIGGAVYGGAFLLARRNLWPLILAHGINDTLGLVFVYFGIIVP